MAAAGAVNIVVEVAVTLAAEVVEASDVAVAVAGREAATVADRRTISSRTALIHLLEVTVGANDVVL